MHRNAFVLSIALLCGLLLISCEKQRRTLALEEDKGFSLEYGNFEDELNVFDFNKIGDIDTCIAMRDGFYYVANGASKKIMEFNSYGDLLNLYYNDEANPTPSFASEEQVVSVTRKATAYPFNKITSIAVDARRYLYVADSLTLERQEQDTEINQILGQVILRFDNSGNFIDYIGQQGPGGTPFPYIKDIFGTNNNELVVYCLVSGNPFIYWFSSSGALLYTINIDRSSIPNPYKSTIGDSWLEIENVIPDYSKRSLYVKVDYFKTHIDETTHLQSGIDYAETIVYTMDVTNQSYSSPLSISPYTEPLEEGFTGGGYNIPYDFLGVSDDGWFFFAVSTSKGFNVLMVQTEGQHIITRDIALDHKKNLFYSFSLSNTGIISVLLLQGEKAFVNWWRTDNLIQAVIKN